MQFPVLNDSFFNYLLYLPKDYDEKKKYPLVLFLHGAGEREGYGDINIVKKHGLPKLCENKDFQAIIVSPQCKEGRVWTSYSQQLKELLDEIVKKYSVDEDAISITGMSMGGFGAYQVLMDYPDIFSCSIIVCGGGMEWRSNVIRDIPLKIYHGEKDLTVPVSHSKEMYAALINNGAKNVELILYPDGGHGIWVKVYEETEAINWLISHKKNK